MCYQEDKQLETYKSLIALSIEVSNSWRLQIEEPWKLLLNSVFNQSLIYFKNDEKIFFHAFQ